MPRYRTTLIINSVSSKPPTGFAERYDHLAGSDSEALEIGKRIAAARRRFLSPNNIIDAIRVASVTSGPRKSPLTGYKLITMAMQVCGTGVAEQSGLPFGAETGSAVLYKCFAKPASGKVSSRRFRGFPNTWWISDGRLQVSVVDAAVQRFAQTLFGVGWRKYTVSQTDGAITDQVYYCVEFSRITTKRTGRPSNLARGRKFAHRRA